MKILVLALLFSFNAYAGEKASRVRCDITTEKDASKCMDKLAEAIPSNEGGPNESVANTRNDLMVALMEYMDMKDQAKTAEKADFVGAVFDHDYETHIYYYALFKGKNKKPELLKDLNVVDLEMELSSAKSLPKPGLFILGAKDVADDVREEVKEKLEEIKGDRKTDNN